MNLVALSRVLAIVSGDDPRQVVRDGLRLSLVMAVGTVALGAPRSRWPPRLLPLCRSP